MDALFPSSSVDFLASCSPYAVGLSEGGDQSKSLLTTDSVASIDLSLKTEETVKELKVICPEAFERLPQVDEDTLSHIGGDLLKLPHSSDSVQVKEDVVELPQVQGDTVESPQVQGDTVESPQVQGDTVQSPQPGDNFEIQTTHSKHD